jgi:hypothetical protein
MFAKANWEILNIASCVCLEADKDDDFSLAQLAAAELPSNHESHFAKASAILVAARCCWLHTPPEGSTIFSNCSAQSTKLDSQSFHIS